MRFVMLMYPGPAAETERSPVPDGPEGQKLLEDMMAFNQRMVDAGIMLGGEGLQPTRKGARVKYQGGGKTVVVDGPFTETKEVLGGYWIIDVPSLADAVAWARQAPCPAGEFVEIDWDEAFSMLEERLRLLVEEHHPLAGDEAAD